MNNQPWHDVKIGNNAPETVVGIIKITFLLLFLNPLNTTFSQEPKYIYKSISMAEIYHEKGEIDSAIILYEQSFKKMKYVHSKFLNSIIELGKIKNDTSLIDKYESIKNEQKNSINQELVKKIDSISFLDQKIRKGKYARASKKSFKCKNRDTTCKKCLKSFKLMKEIYRVDSSNIYTVIELFETYGFIGEELVGAEKAPYIHRFLLHFDKDTNNLILKPILDSALNNGKILPIAYCQIIDRHLYYQNQTQQFWTWAIATKSRLKFSTEEKESIILNRESIGIFYSEVSVEKKSNYWILKNTFH